MEGYFKLRSRVKNFATPKGKKEGLQRIHDYFSNKENNPIFIANDLRHFLAENEQYAHVTFPLFNRNLDIYISLQQLADALDGQKTVEF